MRHQAIPVLQSVFGAELRLIQHSNDHIRVEANPHNSFVIPKYELGCASLPIKASKIGMVSIRPWRTTFDRIIAFHGLNPKRRQALTLVSAFHPNADVTPRQSTTRLRTSTARNPQRPSADAPAGRDCRKRPGSRRGCRLPAAPRIATGHGAGCRDGCRRRVENESRSSLIPGSPTTRSPSRVPLQASCSSNRVWKT